MNAAAPDSLFDKYGGIPTLQRLVRDFHQRMAGRSSLMRYFEGQDTRRMAEHQVELMAYALGKPAKIYNFEQLAVAHHNLGISLSAYEEMIRILRQVLLDGQIEGADINTIINTLDQHRHRIVRDVSPKDGLETVHVDKVTGLRSQVALFETLEIALERQRASLAPLTLMMVGLDQADQVFSLAGEFGRDALVKHIALLVVRTVRDDDFVFRVGPGEFAVLLSAASIEIAHKVAARIANSLAKDPLIHDTRLIRYTVGVGIAGASPSTSPSPNAHTGSGESLLQAARRALAVAQQNGSGKVVDA